VSRYASSAASALLGVALAAIAFGGAGGFEISRVTWVEVGALVASAVLVALAVLRGRRGPLDGGLTLLAFIALAGLTAVSITWSIAPDQSWLSANMTIAYVALFAAGMAIARLAPDGVAVVLRAVLLAAAAVVIYALLTRVYPSLAKDEVFARIGQPYGYWNALGTTAALAVPAALWLGSRRSGHQPVNALAFPLLSLLAVTLFLSYSRGAMIVAGIGAFLWIVLVPLRLRSITLLGVALAGAAPVIVWALGQDAFTKNEASMPVREAIAPAFGLWLVATVLVMLGAGLAIGFRVARRPPRARARLRVGAAAGLVACVVPIVLVIVLVNSDRGLGGTISAGYEQLTSTSRKTPGGPSRLLTASSARGLYWGQAKEVFLDHYWKGTGADTFGTARLRYREPKDQSVSQHAHGYVHQTGADLGGSGLIVSLLLVVAWLVAAGRALGFIRRRRHAPLEWSAERVALAGLALVALVFGMHSLVDWIWFVPGPTAMALVAAGFVVGRGPLLREDREKPALEEERGVAVAPPSRNGAQAATAPVAAPAPVAVGPGVGATSTATDDPHEAQTAVLPPAPPPPPPPPPPAARGRPSLPPGVARLGRPLLALAVLAFAGFAAWSIVQPLRSYNESDRALDLVAENKVAAARRAAERAHDIDPLSPRPYVTLSAVEDAAGNQDAALHALEEGVKAFPGDPQMWLQLALYQLNSLNRPADALVIVQGALFLDPQSRAAQTVYFQANAALHPPPPPPPPPPAPPAVPPAEPTPAPPEPQDPPDAPKPGKPLKPPENPSGGSAPPPKSVN
jgi:hypothetical protein